MTEKSVYFDLFDDGPFLYIGRSLGLIKQGQPALGTRIGLSILITWVPLALLSAIQGLLLGPSAAQSLLKDVAVSAKFFLALPLFILASSIIPKNINMILRHFIDSKLLRADQKDRFMSDVATIARLRNSRMVKFILIGLIYLQVMGVANVAFSIPIESWRAAGPEGQRSLTYAGWWLHLISLPLYCYAVYRFLYRVALWWKMLWKISKLDLCINSSHPDGAGGLGFLSILMGAYSLPCLAITSSSAGSLADLMLFNGVSFKSHLPVIGAYMVILMLLFVGPLFFFMSLLGRAKRDGIISHGALSRKQLIEFESKWIEDKGEKGSMLNEPDFSATVDLSDVVSKVYNMRVIPFELKNLLPIALAVALPFFLVALIEIPLQEILSLVVKMMA